MSFSESKKNFFDITLALISGTLLILCFRPTANLEYLAWFAFLPLFFCLRSKSKGKAFLFSYLCGIIFWFGIIYWLAHVTIIGLVLLVLYLALYFGIFGLIITRYSPTNARYSLFFIPSVWVLLEYLRNYLLTGFGWALLGYSQYLNLPAIQIAGITGVWGVSFLVMMANVFIYRVMGYASCVVGRKQKQPVPIFHYLLPLLVLFLSFGYGFYRLRAEQNTEGMKLRISVIQANIPQAIKWQESAREEIFGRYLRLSRVAAGDSADLIIWPEAALPEILGRDAHPIEKLRTFVDDVQIPLLTGVVRENGNVYYNSAIMLFPRKEFAPPGRRNQSEGESGFPAGTIQCYDKLHLVPFGEYVPFKKALGLLEAIVPIGDFVSGKEYTVFCLNGKSANSISRDRQAKFSVLICFEDIFPEISREFVKRGAGFLINITNDAWFGDTLSPYQHLSGSVLRAVENDVYLVRAANTGISAFVTPEGRTYRLIDNDSGKQTFISGY